MKTTVLILVSCGLALGFASAVRADAPTAVPAAPEAATAAVDGDLADVLSRVPEAQRERLRELEQKDPGAFRDLLRRELAARLLRREREQSTGDLPVELAGDVTQPSR